MLLSLVVVLVPTAGASWVVAMVIPSLSSVDRDSSAVSGASSVMAAASNESKRSDIHGYGTLTAAGIRVCAPRAMVINAALNGRSWSRSWEFEKVVDG